MQKFSYHTHTSISDGKNNIEEMVAKAADLGWEEIGISDHLIVHKDIKLSTGYIRYPDSRKMKASTFAEAYEKLAPNAEKIYNAADKYGIKGCVGYEVDYFDYAGWEDGLREFLLKIKYDYLINGNHCFCDKEINGVQKVYDICQNMPYEIMNNFEWYIKNHFNTIAKAVNSGLFDFLAHFDYVKKITGSEKYKLVDAEQNVVKALKNTGTACEISTKGLRRVGEFYPSDEILQMLVKNNIPMLISDDAHCISELGYAFDKAEEKLSEVRCKNRFHLK